MTLWLSTQNSSNWSLNENSLHSCFTSAAATVPLGVPPLFPGYTLLKMDSTLNQSAYEMWLTNAGPKSSLLWEKWGWDRRSLHCPPPWHLNGRKHTEGSTGQNSQCPQNCTDPHGPPAGHSSWFTDTQHLACSRRPLEKIKERQAKSGFGWNLVPGTYEHSVCWVWAHIYSTEKSSHNTRGRCHGIHKKSGNHANLPSQGYISR